MKLSVLTAIPKSFTGPLLVVLSATYALGNPPNRAPAINANRAGKVSALKDQERMHALLKAKARQARTGATGGSSLPKAAEAPSVGAGSLDATSAPAAGWKNPGDLTGPKGWTGLLQRLLTLALLTTDPRSLGEMGSRPVLTDLDGAAAVCLADPVPTFPLVTPLEVCPLPESLLPSQPAPAVLPGCEAPDLDPDHRSRLTAMGLGKLWLKDPTLGTRSVRFAFRADSPSLVAKGFLTFDDDDLGLSYSGTAREVKVLKWQDGVPSVIQLQGESADRQESARFCCTVAKASGGEEAQVSLSIQGEDLDYDWPLMPLTEGYIFFL